MNLYNDILNALNTHSEFIDNKTDKLKSVLADLGENSYDCAVMAAGNGGRHQQEWLFDMIWYKPYKTPEMKYENPAEFVLALESELSKFNLQGFREDFDRLLISNAPNRVMIFSDRPGLSEEVLQYAQQAIANCRNLKAGETIAVILFDDINTGIYRMQVFTKE
jgi:hypothetical protein